MLGITLTFQLHHPQKDCGHLKTSQAELVGFGSVLSDFTQFSSF